MLSDRAREWSRGLVVPVARGLGRLGLGPNGVTMLGAGLHVGVAWLLAVGELRWGGVALAIAGACDGLDGALARDTGRASRFGAFLDSTFDRVSEVLVFSGLLWYALARPVAPDCRWCSLDALMVLLALAGSLLVSYTRARSEGLGVGTQAGAFGRLERMAVLVVALFLGAFRLGVAIVAVGAWLTVAWRIDDVRRRCRDVDG